MRKHSFRGLFLHHYALTIVLILLGFNTAIAQENNGAFALKGKVIDLGNKSPLGGATISLNGSTNEVITDEKGEFVINTYKKAPYVITVKYVGYLTQEVSANTTYTIVELKDDPNQLNDVVVVGYGTQQKKDLIGVVSKINADDIKNVPAASFDAQLQGRAAGVQINSNSGVPGESVNIKVRGTTSINASTLPLFIIDGVFVNASSLQTQNSGGKLSSPLADISPADIKSIEVLKDASATAIYGTRAANGVVIVTTKRGNYNTPNRVNINLNQGVAKVAKLWDMATGQQNAQIYNDIWINSGIDNPALNRTFANRPFRPVSEGGRGLPEDQQTYDRLAGAYRTARIQNYDVSLQGGNNKSRYYIGGSFTDQQATIRPVYFQRASLKVNLDQKISDNVTIGVSNLLTRSYRNQARTGDGGTGNVVLNSMNLARYLPFKNADGTPAAYTNYDDQQVLLDNLNQNTVSWRLISNLFVDAQLTKKIKFRTSWSVDYNNYDEFIYWNSKLINGAPPTNGSATSAQTLNTTWVNEQTLTYRDRIDRHNFGVLLGNTIQSHEFKNTTANGVGFPNDAFELISSAATTSATQQWDKGNLASFFGRVDYNYDNKYYFEATLRADGASNFGTSNQWGYFPAVGVSWRAKQEDFLKNSNTISDLKIRASYGLLGNQAGISNFAARGLWQGGAPYDGKAGTAPQQLANPNLRWEKTAQANLGVDISLFGKLDLNVDIYEKNTTDVLLELPVQGISGFTNYFSNAGEVNNRGIEIGVNYNVIKTKDWKWDIGANYSYLTNKIKKLPTAVNVYSRNWIRLEEGSSMYAFWLYKQLYVDPQTGAAVYEDVDKDGAITSADRQLMGSAVPKFYGGINTNLSYKNFSLSALFTYQGGNQLVTMYRFFGANGGTRADRVLYASEANYWKQPGDITDVPRPTTVGNNYGIENTSRLLSKGDFLRFKSLNISYSIPKSIVSKIGVNAASVYFQGTNLFILTKYHGPDPEANVSDAQNVQGLDWGASPQPRTIQFGINVTL